MIRYIYVILLFVSTAIYAESFEDDVSNNTESTITELTDKVEKLEHKNKLLQKKIDALAADIDFRFKELEGKAKQTSSKKSAAKAEAVKPADPKLARVKFEKAYALIKEQNYEKAENAFALFIKEYPNNPYTGNAYYWMGESFMLRKKYDKAAVNYLQSFSKFPKNDKADLSMLKLSSALNILGQKKESCSILAKLKAKKTSLSSTIQKLLEKDLKQSGCK